MKTIALFGSGKIGACITAMISRSGRYRLKVCDGNLAQAKQLCAGRPNTEAFQLNLADSKATKEILKDCEAVMSALPYQCNRDVASCAFETNTHYFDLTEDVANAQFTAELAKQSEVCFMPQCGIAPGFISIAAQHLIKSFKKTISLKLRVGALPLFPTNRLKYCLTWSVDGLLNEYAKPCDAIVGGKRVKAPPLAGTERFSLDGNEYEAFNTSGGLGTLCTTLEGQVEELNYKTIRYPGHRDLVSFVMHDLGFDHDIDSLKAAFLRTVPTTVQDKCIILVEAIGHTDDGQLRQATYARTAPNGYIDNIHFSAIQLTTASGICTPLDLLLNGYFGTRKGFVRAEEIALPDYLNNEFGSYMKDEKALAGIL